MLCFFGGGLIVQYTPFTRNTKFKHYDVEFGGVKGSLKNETNKNDVCVDDSPERDGAWVPGVNGACVKVGGQK